MSIDRYDISPFYDSVVEETAEHGEWVKYSDHIAKVDELLERQRGACLIEFFQEMEYDYPLTKKEKNHIAAKIRNARIDK